MGTETGVPWSVSSWAATQSHPAGSMAPVITRAAWPGPRARAGTEPAYTVSTTSSTAGA